VLWQNQILGALTNSHSEIVITQSHANPNSGGKFPRIQKLIWRKRRIKYFGCLLYSSKGHLRNYIYKKWRNHTHTFVYTNVKVSLKETQIPHYTKKAFLLVLSTQFHGCYIIWAFPFPSIRKIRHFSLPKGFGQATKSACIPLMHTNSRAKGR
jgi:hypothetical protein